jgi:hypothetical protein
VFRKTWICALVASSLAALAAAFPAGATDFGNQSIRGTFTLFVEGRAAPGNLFDLVEGTPLYAIATVSFDGAGNCQSKDRIVARGRDLPEGPPLVLRVASACTYSVEPDGFGTFAVTFDEPVPTVTTTTFIITNRNEIQFIANNPELGIYGGGVLRRQSN